MRSSHLKHALLAAAAVGSAVTALLAYSFLNDPSSKDIGVVDNLFAAVVFGAVPAVIAGAATFVISRFDAGRRGALGATCLCVLVSGFIGLVSIFSGATQSTWEPRLHLELHAVIWILCWPFAFGSWMLAELHVGFHRMFQGAQDRAVAASRASQEPGTRQ